MNVGLAAFNRARRIRAAQEADNVKSKVHEQLQLLRERGKELGIPHAGQMGEPKLLEAITAKEAELAQEELLKLRDRATELGIEKSDEKDAETLVVEIEAKEAELSSGKGKE